MPPGHAFLSLRWDGSGAKSAAERGSLLHREHEGGPPAAGTASPRRRKPEPPSPKPVPRASRANPDRRSPTHERTHRTSQRASPRRGFAEEPASTLWTSAPRGSRNGTPSTRLELLGSPSELAGVCAGGRPGNSPRDSASRDSVPRRAVPLKWEHQTPSHVCDVGRPHCGLLPRTEPQWGRL